MLVVCKVVAARKAFRQASYLVGFERSLEVVPFVHPEGVTRPHNPDYRRLVRSTRTGWPNARLKSIVQSSNGGAPMLLEIRAWPFFVGFSI